MKHKELYPKIIINFVLAIVTVLLAFFLLPKLLKFFIPFVIALILSAMANPLVRFLENKVKIVRKHSTAIIIVVALAAIIGLCYLAIVIIGREIAGLIKDLPGIIEQLSELLKQLSEKAAGIKKYFPEGIQMLVGKMNEGTEEFFSSLMDMVSGESGFGIDTSDIFATAGSYVKSIANAVFMIIITILASYFFLAERDMLINNIKKMMPEGVIRGYNFVAGSFKSAIGGYFKAQFKIMFILTGIMAVVFLCMGINYGLLIALGIAFLDMLPVFGTGAVLWPWAVVQVVVGNYVDAVILIILYFACQLIKQLLQPKMVGDSIGVHPLFALIFMFIGYRIAGVIGMIIGIPVGMIIVGFYKMGAFDRMIKGFKIIVSDIDEYRKF